MVTQKNKQFNLFDLGHNSLVEIPCLKQGEPDCKLQYVKLLKRDFQLFTNRKVVYVLYMYTWVDK